MNPNHASLMCGRHRLDLSYPRVMGILNVTPDSFSDGGRHVALDDALRHAERMLAEGAAMIDVGGESIGRGPSRSRPRKSSSAWRRWWRRWCASSTPWSRWIPAAPR